MDLNHHGAAQRIPLRTPLRDFLIASLGPNERQSARSRDPQVAVSAFAGSTTSGAATTAKTRDRATVSATLKKVVKTADASLGGPQMPEIAQSDGAEGPGSFRRSDQQWTSRGLRCIASYLHPLVPSRQRSTALPAQQRQIQGSSLQPSRRRFFKRCAIGCPTQPNASSVRWDSHYDV
jgi:hypothetical protein